MSEDLVRRFDVTLAILECHPDVDWHRAFVELQDDIVEVLPYLNAVLDGADADSGVAFEAGFARGIGKPILGVRTDYRQLQVKGLNVMLAEGCTAVVCHFSFNEGLDDLAQVIVSHIEKLAPRRTAEASGSDRTGRDE